MKIKVVQIMKTFIDIVREVKSHITIPISIKMSSYSAGLANLVKRINRTGHVNGFILFNRYYNPDFDINSLELTSSAIFSTANDLSESLRWIAILSGKIESDFAASTGVHNGVGLVKQLLAGAKAVQVVSAIYNNGTEFINELLKSLENWMVKNNFKTIEDFRGKLNYSNIENPEVFDRVQFMKYFGGIK